MIKRILLTLSAVALLAGLAGCDMSKGLDAAGDAYKGATLTDQEVQEMGRQSAAAMDKQAQIAKGNAYAKRLEKITRNLKNEDGLKLNFKVYMTDEVNAFALPDGSVRVYSGLMDKMKDDNEILFVIGHEIGHVKNGDSKGRYKLALNTSAARKGAAAAGGTAAALSESELGDIGEAFIHAQYSQSQEYAADENGYQTMVKYKKNPAAAVSALRVLQSLGGSADMFSSHPDSGARADKIQEKINSGKNTK